tara:strand:- start:231 stop:398 length:168 start_codon:yes stop_codon:yes gene_type:complete
MLLTAEAYKKLGMLKHFILTCVAICRNSYWGVIYAKGDNLSQVLIYTKLIKHEKD